MTGTSGRPEPEAAHVGVPVIRFVAFQMCCPLGTPKPPKQTYAMFEFVGSIAMRPTYFAIGMLGFVQSVSVDEPVIVPMILMFTAAPVDRL